ncbi:MAG: hypothetical protein ABR936_15430 [Bacteroidota bacterium]|jgi:hypothetical protein
MLNYSDIEKKALTVIKDFFLMNEKADGDVLKICLQNLGLEGSSNAYDPQARARGLCQELKTAFLKAGNNLPPLHLDLEPSTILNNGTWTIDNLIDLISDSFHGLTEKEDVQ